MRITAVSRVICLSIVSVGLFAACSDPQQPVAIVSVAPPSPPPPLSTDNPVSAQASVRATLAATRAYFDKHGDFSNLDEDYLASKVPTNLKFVPASEYFADVSVDVRGDDFVSIAAMSPSGACFGALDDGRQNPSYSHTKIGEPPCDAKDVPYSISGF